MTYFQSAAENDTSKKFYIPGKQTIWLRAAVSPSANIVISEQYYGFILLEWDLYSEHLLSSAFEDIYLFFWRILHYWIMLLPLSKGTSLMKLAYQTSSPAVELHSRIVSSKFGFCDRAPCISHSGYYQVNVTPQVVKKISSFCKICKAASALFHF
jgi:hypothetical protein